ncbi:MAG: hypothetical protein ABW072_19030 [Sedimenticola sp.]
MLRIEIENRPIIPVRLVPFVTGWDFPPDSLVRMLAHRDGFNRVHLDSYHLDADGSHHPILAKEWDTRLADLEILTGTLKASEKVEDEHYPVWREKSIRMLPAATFVWLDELEDVWCTVFSKEWMTLPNERQGDRELNLSPLIDSNMADIIYEGFESLISTDAPQHDDEHNSIPATQVHADEVHNRFTRTGDVWTITFNDQYKTFKNTKGLRYIEYLIRHQGKAVHVFELYYAINPTNSEATDPIHSAMSTEQLLDMGLSVGDLGDAGDTLPPEGEKYLKQHIEQIQEQIEDAIELGNYDRQLALEEEQEELFTHIAKETGLNGRTRKASSNIERVRKSVSKRISHDVKKIIDIFPDLGHHLKETLSTGTKCSYSPHPPVTWFFDTK